MHHMGCALQRVKENKMRKIILLLAPLIFLLVPLKGYAQTKEMTVGLTDVYTQATFYLEFETEQTYNVVVTYPSGLTHETTIEGNEGTISISDIENGEYKVTITADDDINVKSRVEAKKTEISANPKDINISTVVSGLQIYFKDTDLCIEWDKNANEDVIDIEIIEPNSMQVLDSAKLNDNFYSLDFDESIKQLEVYLVPAKSANIDGAGTRFTIDVVLDNGGRVKFPNETLYNVSEYSFDVSILDNMTVFVDEDGKIVYDNTYNVAGDYNIVIPLNDMKNHITVWLKDDKGNLNSFSTVIDRDIEAPVFNISPFDTVTKNSSINISGSVTEATSVFFNDFEVLTDEYGRFSFDNALIVGDNNISLTAADEAGNVTRIDYVITRKEVNYTPALVIAIIGFIVLFMGVISKKKKEFSQNPKSVKSEKPTKKEKVVKEKTSPFFSASGKKEKKEKVKPEIRTKEIKKPIKRSSKSVLNGIFDYLPICVFIAVVLITMTCLIKNTVVASASMEPTLKTGSICLYNKLAYKYKPISRGDIICFYSTEQNEVMSKRVIGIAGDEISFKDGYIFINGLKAEESYISEDMETNSTKTFTVPEGSVFVLGDNRDNSYDSRYWENPYISVNQIYGKYLGTIG